MNNWVTNEVGKKSGEKSGFPLWTHRFEKPMSCPRGDVMWATWIWTVVLRSGLDILIGSKQHIIGTPTLRSEWKGDPVEETMWSERLLMISQVFPRMCNSS